MSSRKSEHQKSDSKTSGSQKGNGYKKKSSGQGMRKKAPKKRRIVNQYCDQCCLPTHNEYTLCNDCKYDIEHIAYDPKEFGHDDELQKYVRHVLLQQLGSKESRDKYKNASQDDDEEGLWKEARKGKILDVDGNIAYAPRITGTKLYPASNHNISLKKDILWPELRKPFMGNLATRYGKRHENSARVLLGKYVDTMLKREMDRTGEKITWRIVEYGLWIIKEHPWCGVSPDGFLIIDREDKDGIVRREVILLEFKCPYGKRSAYSGIPIQYKHQVQGIMNLMGLKSALFVQWFPTGMKVERVLRDKAWWSKRWDRIRFCYFQQILPALYAKSKGLLEEGSVDWSMKRLKLKTIVGRKVDDADFDDEF